jgi:5-methyltetrahydropteroyltriglutamate--homocysteine methyltransferase
MLHFRGGRAGISKDAYPELDPVFYDDVAKAYGDELRSLAAAGCTYVQMDDTNLAYLCDEHMREAARKRGDDPNELPHRYAAFINKVVAQKPPGMLLAMHLCRGNFKSTHAAAGNYEPVAEALLKEMDLDAYFMEYDDARSGDFKPLRYLPKGKTVVLGLVTTKFGQMEDKDELKRRIDEAAKYARSSSWRCRRSAASPARCTATTSRWKRSATSCAWWSRPRRKSGARLMLRRGFW